MFDLAAPFLDALRGSPALLIACAVLLGLMSGSFLNVVIHRLPKMMEAEWQASCASLSGHEHPPAPAYNLVTPRSACPACGHRIGALENIPVLSYLFLGGKCAGCRKAISPRYPLVEILSGTLAGLIAWKFGYGTATVAAWLFAFALVALTFIDFDTRLLPDDITLPLLWGGLLFNLGHTFTDLRSAVIGAMAGYLILWTVYWLFRLVTGKEGMGYGDFKLLAALGAWMGWQMILPIVLMSAVVGAVVGIVMITRHGRGRQVPMAFGPYLAAAGWVMLMFGPEIVSRYLGLFPTAP